MEAHKTHLKLVFWLFKIDQFWTGKIKKKVDNEEQTSRYGHQRLQYARKLY